MSLNLCTNFTIFRLISAVFPNILILEMMINN